MHSHRKRILIIAVLIIVALVGPSSQLGCSSEEEDSDSDCEQYWTCDSCTASGPAGAYTEPSTYTLDCDMSPHDVAQYMADDCTDRVQEMDPLASCSCIESSCHKGEGSS